MLTRTRTCRSRSPIVHSVFSTEWALLRFVGTLGLLQVGHAGCIVDCSANLYCGPVPNELPNTEFGVTLELSGRGISGFAGAALGCAELLNVSIVDLSNNSFIILPAVTMLDSFIQVILDNNFVEEIPDGYFEQGAFNSWNQINISLKNNSITQLRPEALSSFNASQLILLLDSNTISVLPSDVFSQYSGSNLFVTLNDNRITHLPSTLFQNLRANSTSMYMEIRIENNQIEQLEPRMFSTNANALALWIYLDHNLISSLPHDLFSGSPPSQLVVQLTSNYITSLGPRIFSTFQGPQLSVILTNNSLTRLGSFTKSTGFLEVYVNGNNISQLSPGFFRGISSDDDNYFIDEYMQGNPLHCHTYGPQLTNCTCTRPHDVFHQLCGYAGCLSESSECAQGAFPTSSCVDAPRSQCISQCSNASEYLVVDPTSKTAICLPKSVCQFAYPFDNQTRGYFAAYELVNATTTSDRVCQRCTTCAAGFHTTPCTAMEDSECTAVSSRLSPGVYAAIILLSIAGVTITVVLCCWGRSHKTKKEESELSYVLQSETLEMTTKLLSVEEKKVKDTEQSWKIHWSDLELGELLGRGAFGVVNRAHWLGSFVAVKVLEVNIELLDVESSGFEREVAAMQSLHHPNLVTFYGFGTTSAGKPFLVSELMNQTLRERLRANKTKLDVDWNEARRWCADIVAGMLFLHTRTPPMVHRDLKSDNCLLGENDIVKIADFGTVTRPSDGESKFTSSATTSTSLVMSASIGAGTPLWMAPEVMSGLHGISHYGLSVDVYSFGMVMYEIATQQLPFCPDCDSMNQFEFNDFVIGGGRPQVKEGLPKAYVQLMEQCWSNDPESRPTFTQLSPMFAKLKLHTMSSLFFGSANQSS
eukprot:m.235996 g.235996  ORF g.235996 m.235996 type:complete len:872 (-) comp33674_c0_seq3:336-2951(-)